jgi:hypothetical protein
MSESSTYPLRLPKSLKRKVAEIAKNDGTSLNQFIAMAVAEKVSAIETETFFSQRAAEADLTQFKALLTRSGGQAPSSEDVIE